MAEKVSKSEAQYQERPKAGQHCNICVMYLGSGRCDKVEGKINPFAWCKFFYASAKGSVLR